MLFKPVAMEIYLHRLKRDNHLATGSTSIITMVLVVSLSYEIIRSLDPPVMKQETRCSNFESGNGSNVPRIFRCVRTVAKYNP